MGAMEWLLLGISIALMVVCGVFGAAEYSFVAVDRAAVERAAASGDRAAIGVRAAYLIQSDDGGPRDQMDWTPEFSRRARGFAVYAALRQLGRTGVVELVERCCDNARLFAELLEGREGARILNDVVLNQVLVRFGEDDAVTADVVRRVQEDGTCWLSGTTWQGVGAMRISVSNWRTTAEDVERSVEAILRCARAASPERVG